MVIDRDYTQRDHPATKGSLARQYDMESDSDAGTPTCSEGLCHRGCRDKSQHQKPKRGMDWRAHALGFPLLGCPALIVLGLAIAATR